MNIKVLKRTDNELKIEIQGADHGLCNLLQKKILEEKNVDVSGYDVPHPLASSPVIYIRMLNGASPDEALISAAKKAMANNETFSKELENAVKA
ncbi:MAG: DNA-directed RNA polymerase subunit L [Candidatus Bathyarchaeota archaeon]|nr:DNA-directed RNA polymerase subunit L [Candidatus Bathyarchaeota archaeon]